MDEDEDWGISLKMQVVLVLVIVGSCLELKLDKHPSESPAHAHTIGHVSKVNIGWCWWWVLGFCHYNTVIMLMHCLFPYSLAASYHMYLILSLSVIRLPAYTFYTRSYNVVRKDAE